MYNSSMLWLKMAALNQHLPVWIKYITKITLAPIYE